MRVLLVEDGSGANGGITQAMKTAGFTVDHVTCGEDAIGMLRGYDYDLAILELMLPDMEGYEVVRRIRNARIDTPVIILSSLTRPQAKVKAFSVGADDYLTRPVDQEELVARMLAILRRSKGFSEPALRVGMLTLTLDSREVMVGDVQVHLTGKEYAILELLVLRKGMVLTKDAFLNHLYGGMDEPEMKIIDVFICKLRKKLQAAGGGSLISTVWGRGYTLRDPNMRASEPMEAAEKHAKAVLAA
ncbi:MAG: response regulator transcription factor [Acetobacter sp.]|jgi:two-component system cell cycle response regulator CtrA|nr:response regulator transcription factor [Acetobacter sp.]MCH4061908.1 response regulator transcription factor [Acetobacter sp.]MCH4089243.1 response regulator transcription factor [Acetobacter sp.]MCI1293585.1 response regulator transcription factor [Acetobacter sp.]MCI1320334.1 response regulator transcription factor [Acetobacter sp.]